MKLQFLSLIATGIIFSVCSNHSTIEKKNIGKKIGYVKENQYRFSIDTVSFKEQWQNMINLPNVKLEKIEICKNIIKGGIQEDYYMLIAYDKTKSLKTARWLVREGDSLYFFKNTSNEDIPNEIFYRTYFTCHGSTANCSPEVFYVGTEYIWATSEKLYCAPDDPCKSISTFIPDE